MLNIKHKIKIIVKGTDTVKAWNVANGAMGHTVSATDSTGRTVYYEYDGLGIKDDQGNIIKHICYNYAGQVINCNQ